MRKLKICVVGKNDVGKSSICSRFLKNSFRIDYEPTIEDLYEDTIRFGENVLHLQIVDTGGKHEYDDVRKRCYKTGDAFMLVFSVDSKASFDALYDFHEEINHQLLSRKRKGKKKISFLLVGNKSDLTTREVSLGQARRMASHFACDYQEVCARRGLGIKECFEKLMRHHIKRNERRKSDLGVEEEEEEEDIERRVEDGDRGVAKGRSDTRSGYRKKRRKSRLNEGCSVC